jgi:hypothetical protein
MDFSKVAQQVELPMVVAHLELMMMHLKSQIKHFQQC